MTGVKTQETVATDPAERLNKEIPRSGGAVDFDQIYKLYGRRVYWWCARMVGDNAEAEDLAQDSFLQLYRSIHTYRGESAFTTWLHRVVVTVVLGRMRRKAIPTVPLEGSPETEENDLRGQEPGSVLHGPVPNPLDRVSLEKAMVKLPSTFRTILILHDVQGYRHFEIARILGVPVGTSKSYLHRARLQMRNLLTAQQPLVPRRPARSRIRKITTLRPKRDGEFDSGAAA